MHAFFLGRKMMWKCFILLFATSLLGTTSTKKTHHKHPVKGVKYILYWSDMLGNNNFYFGKTGFELFKNCKIKNCYATKKRNLMPLEEYDALLFYSPTKYKYRNHSLPKKRSRHQRYVYANSETPIRFHGRNKVRFVKNDYFNWTMSYRLDSDIVRWHGYVHKKQNPNYTYPKLSSKKKFAAVFVSNCDTPSKRELLLEELQKYVSVDVYGKCGNLTCPRNNPECFNKLDKDYKFYLSFENSYCKDYITEKLYYNALNKNIVPVVYGGGDYKRLAPPTSVINVEDFNSVKDLAKYLKKISKNETEYLKYFEWKPHYTIDLSGKMTVCKLCEKLNDPDEPEKVYKDIKKWWFDPEYSGCKQPKNLPKIVKDLL